MNLKKNGMDFFFENNFSSFDCCYPFFCSSSRWENVYFGNFSHHWWLCIVSLLWNPPTLPFTCIDSTSVLSNLLTFRSRRLGILRNITNAIWRKYDYNEYQPIWNKTFCVFFAILIGLISAYSGKNLKTNNLHFEFIWRKFEKLFKYFHNNR